MKPPSAADAYRRQSIENAPPVKVVQMLYAAALRHLDRALASDPHSVEGGSAPAFVEALSRADQIVIELRLALDAEAAPELAGSLQQLYLFVEERIAQALSRREHGPLEEARTVMSKLQQGWAALEVDPAAGRSRSLPKHGDAA